MAGNSRDRRRIKRAVGRAGVAVSGPSVRPASEEPATKGIPSYRWLWKPATIGTLAVAGATMIQLDEYWLAVVCWLAAGVIAVCQVWPRGGPRWIFYLQAGAITALVVVAIVWTVAKKDDRPWSVFFRTPTQQRTAVESVRKRGNALLAEAHRFLDQERLKDGFNPLDDGIETWRKRLLQEMRTERKFRKDYQRRFADMRDDFARVGLTNFWVDTCFIRGEYSGSGLVMIGICLDQFAVLIRCEQAPCEYQQQQPQK